MKTEIMTIALAAFAMTALPTVAQSQSAPKTINQGSANVSVGGKAAARKGDAAGAGVVSSGSSNVFINGKPAARQGDRTNCGGIVVGGNASVMINGKPMAASGNSTSGC